MDVFVTRRRSADRGHAVDGSGHRLLTALEMVTGDFGPDPLPVGEGGQMSRIGWGQVCAG